MTPDALEDEQIRPFVIAVPDAVLADLRRRLSGARWATEPAGDLSGLGARRATIEDLVRYWGNEYDWRAWENRLNRYPQYTTTIDGANIHFLQIRSPEPRAVPLILTHGWPGSVAEFADVIGPLTDPKRHGFSNEIAFDLVIPSLPGFTWSGPTPDTGWGPQRIARAWAVLMARLGYRRYGAAGNDWGSHISPELGRVATGAVIGVHVTQVFSFPPGEWIAYPPTVEPERDGLSAEDRRSLVDLRRLQQSAGAYAHVHAQRALTLGYALDDSPVGLLAWNGQAMGDLDPDALLTHVTAYWVTDTASSALRIYAEDRRQRAPSGPTTVPLGLAQFRDDLRSIRAYAERDHAAIISWNTYDHGGHFAAHQATNALVDDIRGFYLSLTGAGGSLAG